jgi:hypothetical protein
VVDVGKGQQQTVLYNIADPEDVTYIGKPGPKWNPKSSEDDKLTTMTRRDISTRLRDAQRGYSAALKTGDPDSIASAVDLIRFLNDEAKVYGIPQLPVPKRPMTSDETATLRDQATANLKANRSALGKFFNTSPSEAEINAEMQRLKSGGVTGQSPQQQQPKTSQSSGSGSHELNNLPEGAQYAGVTKDGRKAFRLPDGRMVAAQGGSQASSSVKPITASNPETGQRVISYDNGKSWQPLPSSKDSYNAEIKNGRITVNFNSPSGGFNTAPPAAQHTGRIIRDTASGKRYRSNGSAWVEVR